MTTFLGLEALIFAILGCVVVATGIICNRAQRTVPSSKAGMILATLVCFLSCRLLAVESKIADKIGALTIVGDQLLLMGMLIVLGALVVENLRAGREDAPNRSTV